MKNPQAHLADDAAINQLNRFLIAAWVVAVIAFFFVGWAAVASFAFGARCIVLSWHKANLARSNSKMLRGLSIGVVVVSVVELALVVAANN